MDINCVIPSLATLSGPDYIEWHQFKSDVLGLMPQDSQRIFAQGEGDYINRLIRLAVIDLQYYVPSFTKRHETLYYPGDLVRDGAASVGTLPPGCRMESMWFYDQRNRKRYPVFGWPWERRFEMAQKEVPDYLFGSYQGMTASSYAAIELVNRMLMAAGACDKRGLVAIDPAQETFYLYPELKDGLLLSMFWSGRKLDFKENELVPFEEQAVGAVADWVRSNIAKEVDRDPARAADFMRDYALKRNMIYIDNKDRTNIKSRAH